MDYLKKNKAQLISEIEHLQQRLQEAGTSLNIYQRENSQKISILETFHEYLQSIIDNIPDSILVIDDKYHVVLANKKAREIAGGIDPVKAGLCCYQISHRREEPCRGEKYSCPLKRIMETKSTVTAMHTHYDSDGNEIFVEISASPILDEKREVVQIIEIVRDITERRKMEESLRESEMRYRSLFEQSSDAILILKAGGHNAGKILSANKSACLMYGYTLDEMLGLSILALDTPESDEKAPGRIKDIFDGEIMKFEVMHRKKDGIVFPVEVSASPLTLGDQKLVLAIDRDISERRKAEEELNKLIKELEYTSQTDGLTGLMNRQHLDKRLSEETSRAERYRNPLSLIMFDVDNFKHINDTFGHIAGDKILQNIAGILKETLRDTDIAGRFGGDEFIVILVQTDIKVGMQVAERINSRIGQIRIALKERQAILTISVGICQYNKKMGGPEGFIIKADEALYRAKHSGYNKICKAVD